MLDNINSTLSIVLIGDFPPALFNPSWFLKNKLINEKEYDFIVNGKQLFVSQAFTMFQTDSFVIRVDQERFSLDAKQSPYSVIINLLKGIFVGLSTLNIKSYGINFSTTIILEREQFIAFGKKICPRKNFKKFFEEISNENELKNGLVSMALTKECDFGLYNLSISSSKKTKMGIVFNSNFHHEKDGGYFVENVVDDIEQNWKGLNDIHNATVDDVLESVLKHG